MTRRKSPEPLEPVTNEAPTSTPEPVFWTEAQLRARWGNAFAPITFRIWRSQRRGPPWVKIAGRVFYPIAGVLEYEQGPAGKVVRDRGAVPASAPAAETPEADQAEPAPRAPRRRVKSEP